jgi:tRNA-2-methylthio-N6-dimethylallyladenosine synthase
MNRQYSRETYLEIVKYIRKKMPKCTISTDIIVGFPGETEYDFDETLSIIKEVKFHNIFSFIYSKRTSTKAADLPDYASPVEKTSRMTKLLTLQREIATAMYAEYVGKTLVVLFDGVSKTEGYISGKSDENIIVEASGTKDKIGEYRKVRITKSHNWALEGEIL